MIVIQVLNDFLFSSWWVLRIAAWEAKMCAFDHFGPSLSMMLLRKKQHTTPSEWVDGWCPCLEQTKVVKHKIFMAMLETIEGKNMMGVANSSLWSSKSLMRSIMKTCVAKWTVYCWQGLVLWRTHVILCHNTWLVPEEVFWFWEVCAQSLQVLAAPLETQEWVGHDQDKRSKELHFLEVRL